MLIFTKHAFDRVNTRLTMSPADLIEIIEKEKALVVDIQSEGRRKCWLFYSQQDDECFVMVITVSDNMVITVLPLTHYGKPILVEDQTRARELILGRTAGTPSISGGVYKFVCKVLKHSSGGKAFFQLKWPIDPAESDPNIAKLYDNADLQGWLRDSIEEKLEHGDTIIAIKVHAGGRFKRDLGEFKLSDPLPR